MFKALGGLRRQAYDEIERLLAFLDELDGDPDLEPAGDELDADADSEPSLAAPEHHPDGEHDGNGWGAWDAPRRDHDGTQPGWCSGSLDDCELADDTEEDDSHDGREPDVEDEPSLGAFDRLANQDHAWRQTQGDRTWWQHTNNDAEIERAI